MKRFLALAFVAALLGTSTGCGGNDPDSLTKKSISQINDLAGAIEKKESIDSIKSRAEKLKETSQKLSALKLSPEESKKVAEKYQKETLEAVGKLMKALMSNPEAMTALAGMGGLGDGFQVSSSSSTSTGVGQMPTSQSGPPTPAGSGTHSAGRVGGKK